MNETQFEVRIPESAHNLNLPDPGLLTLYKNIDNRTIWIDHDIDESVLEYSKLILSWNAEDEDHNIPAEKRKPIKIFIFSNGGDVACCLNLCTIMRMSKTPVVTVNAGIALSCGCLILMGGHKGMRYTLPYARALIHQGSGGVSGTYAQVEDATNDYKIMIGIVKKYILESTTLTAAQISKNWKRDWYIGADEMLKYGVVDKVLTDLDEILV